jgi:hypothetical protein
MAEQRLQQSLSIGEHQHVISAYACGALAAIILRYVASVAHPVFGHAILAVLAVVGIVAGYLLIARADLDENQRAGNIIGAVVVGGVCLAIVSYLV